MATHSSILAWRIPGIVKPGWLQSTGVSRLRHNLVTKPPPKVKPAFRSIINSFSCMSGFGLLIFCSGFYVFIHQFIVFLTTLFDFFFSFKIAFILMIFFSFNNILEICIMIFVGFTVFYYGDLLSFIFLNYCLYQLSHSIVSFSW